jgi:hypothetical protein
MERGFSCSMKYVRYQLRCHQKQQGGVESESRDSIAKIDAGGR